QDDQTPVTVFIFDAVRDRDKLPLARNALKKSRTIRHPDMLRFIEGAETDSQIIIGTEPVEPLDVQLRDASDPNIISWGLYKIASAIKFLNGDCSMIHGNLRKSSIYTTKSGEWRLAGFELLSSIKEDNPTIVTYGGAFPNSSKYTPPEVAKGSWSAVRNNPPSAVDSWAFAVIIYEIFNGNFSRPDDLAGQRGSIPQELFSAYRSFLNPNPKARLDLARFSTEASQKRCYFDNDFIQANLFLEQMAIKDTHEKDQFLRKISGSLEAFPVDFCKYKILPELIKALEFGGAGAKALTPILKLANKLPQAEFDLSIVPIIVKLFASPDRAIRVTLCENMGHFIEHLDSRTVTDKIFPNMATGFNDSSAIIREHTLKSVLMIIPKLSEKIVNNDLLRYLAKLQQDEEPGIRTNTAICLGKIGKHLNESTRKKVLVPAFLRSLGDPFTPARNAGLLALAATAEFYEGADLANQVVPRLCPLLLDAEKIIRVQALKNIELFLKRLEKIGQGMPDSAATIPSPVRADSISSLGGSTGAGAGASTASGSGEGWAGWALSAVSNKIANTLVSSTAELIGERPPTEPPTPAVANRTDSGLKNLSADHNRFIITAPMPASAPSSSGWDDGEGNGWDEDETQLRVSIFASYPTSPTFLPLPYTPSIPRSR
ncbi:armadillo-type protein, partial [Blyttiomyces helicus]